MANPAKVHLPAVLVHTPDTLLTTWDQVEKDLIAVKMSPENHELPQVAADGKINVSGISKVEGQRSAMFKALTRGTRWLLGGLISAKVVVSYNHFGQEWA